MDPRVRALVLATQEGLPPDPEPFLRVAERLGWSEEEVLELFRRLLAERAVRRIAAVPHHLRLGVRANAMSVFDVDDAEVDRLGAEVGGLPFVSHCYRRPRRPPAWPYNLFAMVHGRDRAEAMERVIAIKDRLGAACKGWDVLWSTRVLKKTGLRLVAREEDPCSV